MGPGTILVVDDERDLADLYSMWVDDQYEVRTAYGGEAALEKIDESVDIVLLDRRMPDLTGDEVLERIRDRGFGARVVMVTAVDPGLDVIELDFDEYLTKPVSRPELNRVIENMRIQRRRSGALQEHATVSNKMAVLEDEHDPETLEKSEEYRNLQARLRHLGDSLTDGDESDGAASEGAGGRDRQQDAQEAVAGSSVEAEQLEELSKELDDF